MEYPKVKLCLDTSEDDLVEELYTPCFMWAERFDRGLGILQQDGLHTTSQD